MGLSSMEYNSFLASLPEWCKKALKSSPIQYKVSLEEISLLDLQVLSNFIQNISDIGVSGFGYRCFWKNGDTSILALNEDGSVIKVAYNKKIIYHKAMQ
tara:strand:- start:1371 stop:1667 length:297 start_codon:yes stop_codon:yes gene_type:complete